LLEHRGRSLGVAERLEDTAERRPGAVVVRMLALELGEDRARPEQELLRQHGLAGLELQRGELAERACGTLRRELGSEPRLEQPRDVLRAPGGAQGRLEQIRFALAFERRLER
jgi:hypothetical protein